MFGGNLLEMDLLHEILLALVALAALLLLLVSTRNEFCLFTELLLRLPVSVWCFLT